MLTILKHFFPQSLGFILFILVFTISAIGLRPNGKSSIYIALASLSVQFPLIRYVTESVEHGALHISYLDYLYVTTALSQLFIVRILAPSLLSWFLHRLYAMFPNVVRLLVRAMRASTASALDITETIARNWISFLFKTSETYERFMKTSEAYERSMNPATATAVMVSARQRASTLLELGVSGAPLYFIIPSEFAKYHILNYAVESYSLGKAGSKCRNIIIMAVVMSIPIAHAEIVTSWSSLVQDVSYRGEWHTLTLAARVLAFLGAYMSSMLSCVMLGVRVAEKRILKRKYRMWTVRLSSFALMWFSQVLMWLSTSDDVLEEGRRTAFSCTLLLVLISAGLSVWSRVARLIADEQLIALQESKMR